MGKFIDLAGKRFGRLLVIERDTFKPRVHWICKCDCGNISSVLSQHLRRGASKSCGCLHKEQLGTRAATHHGSHTREYCIYANIKVRCTKPSHPRWARYGGRGIKMCERWLASFAEFIADMGPSPSRQHSIDRIDNDGDYSPENCRWATPADQIRNTCRTRMLTMNGKTLCMADWAAEIGISPRGLSKRIAAGWSIEDALTIVPRRITKGGHGVLSPLDRIG